MACLDHVCVACGFAWMDNRIAHECDRCGSRVSNDFDEDLRDHYEGGRDHEDFDWSDEPGDDGEIGEIGDGDDA